MWAPWRASLARTALAITLAAALAAAAAGCTPAAPRAAETAAAPTQAAAPALLPTASPTPLPPTPAQPTAVPSPSPAPFPEACSPLEGFSLEQIPAAVTNPYHPPRPGTDDPHAGIDLADLASGSQVALAGRTVQAAIAGRVAAVVHDRFPFGNALIVETPLEDLPAGQLGGMAVPSPAPPQGNRSALICPGPTPAASGVAGRRSLYLLYAHLAQAPELQPGDEVACGQRLGQVGDSGNALNPHLHLEVRAGPAGTRFSSLAHYDASASEEEMANYCAWTVSGLFQLVDPLNVIH